MKVKDAFNEVVDKGVLAVTGKTDFQKKRIDFLRRHGSTFQVINIQPSDQWRGNNKIFYVNIGIGFDELWQHYGSPMPKQPKVYECHFYTRLDALFSDCPMMWVISDDITATQFLKQNSRLDGREIATNELEVIKVAAFLASIIQKTVSELDQIDGARAFLNSSWKDKPSGSTMVLNPLLAYVIGDLDRAWDELVKISKRFSDREGMSVPELVNSLKLDQLRNRL